LLLFGSLIPQTGCQSSFSKAKNLHESAWQKAKLGDLPSAIVYAQSGLARFPDSSSEWHWRFLVLKSELLMRSGHYEDSLALLRSDLPPAFARTDTAVWRKLTQGSSLGYLERFPEATAALLEAQSLASSVEPQLLGETMLRQGTLASLQWDLRNAQSLYRSSLQFAREHHDPFLEASALGSLGVVAARMERHDESIDWNKQALQLDQSQGWLGLTAKAEGNIGWSYYELGDFDNSLELYERAEKDAIRAGLHHERVLWLTSAGTAHYALEDYDAAERESREALGLARRLDSPADVIECLQNLAAVTMQKGQYESARNQLREVADFAKKDPDSKRDTYTQLLTAHLATKSGDLASALGMYSKISNDPDSATSVRWEAQAGLAQVHALQGNPALAEAEFNASIATISKARDALQHEDFRLSFLSSAIRFYDAYVNFLIERNRPLDALKIADLSRAQTLEEGLSPAKANRPGGLTFNPQGIARRLNATLLFYWLGQDRSYLWTVTASKISLLRLPASGEIDATVKSYRRAFLDPRDPLEAENSDGKKLYSTLIQPAEKLIRRNSRVIILPDGSLNSLNFETLIVSAPQDHDEPHYWIEDVTIVTANSLALLARSSLTSPPKDGRLLLVGDALPASPDFPPLPLAGREVGLLGNHFGPEKRTELTGEKATATGFLRSQPEKFSYLHFATHGTASRLRPLESAVILSPEGDSYKLYARDVVKLPLNAYLVTISACNGAGTKSYAGEGLVGLSWAFLRAGAHNVIAGLWEVSNASTPQLMDELYKGLRAGEDPATALRKAKLTLVHSAGNYRKPFYWAPFLVYLGS
jgi:CHAT domain-containing protein